MFLEFDLNRAIAGSAPAGPTYKYRKHARGLANCFFCVQCLVISKIRILIPFISLNIPLLVVIAVINSPALQIMLNRAFFKTPYREF